MRAKLTVYRFNPGSDKKPRYDTFEIDIEPDETVLAALINVYEKFDPSLSFRFVCGKLKCGECSIMVNKSPCLACEKKIEPEMTIEPLPNLPLIKDLVIDRNKVLKAIFKLAPLLGKSPNAADRAGVLDSQDVDTYVKLTSCLECLMCQSACPVLRKNSDKFVGPLGLLWLAQASLMDSSKHDEVSDLVEMCTGCGKCWKACPSKADFLEDAITGLLNKGEA
jgi:succinate dehydrogenase / fumarate reductase iron-sulfur subunit